VARSPSIVTVLCPLKVRRRFVAIQIGEHRHECGEGSEPIYVLEG